MLSHFSFTATQQFFTSPLGSFPNGMEHRKSSDEGKSELVFICIEPTTTSHQAAVRTIEPLPRFKS